MTRTALSVEAQLELPGHFRLVTFSLEERISVLTRGELEIACDQPIDTASLISTDAVVTVRYESQPARHWTLKVGSGRFERVVRNALRYRFVLQSPLWRQTHTENVRKFRNLSSKDIISTILGEGLVAHRWNIQRPPPVRKFCVQYGESNLDFVLRLLEFEGIFYTLDDDGVLVLEDNSAGVNGLAGGAHFELMRNAGSLEAGDWGISEFRTGRQIASGKATVNDFNWKTPSVDLLKTSSADRDAELEIYHYPTGYRKPGQGAFLSQIRAEALHAEAKYVDGKSNVGTMMPGRSFTFGSDAGALFAGEYLLVSVSHEAHDTSFDLEDREGQMTYVNRFRAIPKAVPFRPPLQTPHPSLAGCNTAKVRGPAGSEIHTDTFGRFRAQFHWDREGVGTDDDSRWVRKLQESATSMNLARVGWEVTIAYINGDPDRPIGIAREVNGIMIPTYGQPAQKMVMTTKTPSSPATGGFNELKLDDTSGAQMFYMRAEKDMLNAVRHDKTEKVGNNDANYVGSNFSRAVTGNQDITIGANNLYTIGATLSRNVVGSRSLSVGASETIKSGAAILNQTSGNETETVGALRFTFTGTPVMPDVKAQAKAKATQVITSLGSGADVGEMANPLALMSNMGSISRYSKVLMNRMVGGAFIGVAIENITAVVKNLYLETVGGAFLGVAGGTINQVISGPLTHTVGAVEMRQSTLDMTASSPVTTMTAGMNITLTADEKIELRSDHIIIEASESLAFSQGDLLLKLEPDQVTLKGALRLEAPDKVVVSGKDDNLTEL